MRYRDDTDDISLEAEDQAVRKSLELDSAVNAIKPSPKVGVSRSKATTRWTSAATSPPNPRCRIS
jgi:hypothetical protein